MIPYGRQTVDEDDVRAVVEVLHSAWLTTGPMVDRFESDLAARVGAKHAVAVSSGTAALHAMMYAIGLTAGDEVIVPPMTFASTANSVVFQGATPVFTDVDPETLLLCPDRIEEKITDKTRAVLPVDYAGQPCDYDALRDITDRHNLVLLSDACHALGARDKDRPTGILGDLTAFSFHPVKHIATGEGGMITTDDDEFAQRMRIFRNHCITTDHRQRAEQGSWFYEMVDLGFNYRITDIQCALGVSQLKKLSGWLARRRAIARRYDEVLAEVDGINPLGVRADCEHAYHLYVVRLDLEKIGKTRQDVFGRLRAAGVGVNVHYIPVHFHPFYRRRFGTSRGLCPVAESAYERILSLPMYAGLTEQDQQTVIQALRDLV